MRTVKVIGLIILAALCFWVCLKASGQPVPPRPKLIATVQSPKGKEFAASLAKVPPPPAMPLVFVGPGKTLAWTWNPDADNPASNVVFLVRSTVDLTTHPSTWFQRTVTTNKFWTFPASLNSEFFRAWASNIVTHQVSP